MGKILNEKQMLYRCKEKHGELYEYDFLNFRKNRKIIIKCSIHGNFEQNYYDHLKGCGCPKCSGVGKLNNEEFIKRANIVHNNKYDYSMVEYKNVETKVLIKCLTHGEFKQTPHCHLDGQGCFFCGKEKTLISNFETHDNFLKKAIEIHGNKYEYISKYSSQKEKIKILCKKHGIFLQTPKYHLQGNGCQKCGLEFKGKIKSNEDFVKLANEIHNYKYDYSKTNFTFSVGKIIIICPIHGEFKQLAKNHLCGRGCPSCKTSNGEREIMKILESNNVNYTYQKKFEKCKNIKNLPFDFYLEDYSICVEFDGEQHYKATEYFGGEKTFEKIKIRDKIKEKFCQENNLKLIRIRFDESIQEKMDFILKK